MNPCKHTAFVRVGKLCFGQPDLRLYACLECGVKGTFSQASPFEFEPILCTHPYGWRHIWSTWGNKTPSTGRIQCPECNLIIDFEQLKALATETPQRVEHPWGAPFFCFNPNKPLPNIPDGEV